MLEGHYMIYYAWALHRYRRISKRLLIIHSAFTLLISIMIIIIFQFLTQYWQYLSRSFDSTLWILLSFHHYCIFSAFRPKSLPSLTIASCKWHRVFHYRHKNNIIFIIIEIIWWYYGNKGFLWVYYYISIIQRLTIWYRSMDEYVYKAFYHPNFHLRLSPVPLTCIWARNRAERATSNYWCFIMQSRQRRHAASPSRLVIADLIDYFDIDIESMTCYPAFIHFK